MLLAACPAREGQQRLFWLLLYQLASCWLAGWLACYHPLASPEMSAHRASVPHAPLHREVPPPPLSTQSSEAAWGHRGRLRFRCRSRRRRPRHSPPPLWAWPSPRLAPLRPRVQRWWKWWGWGWGWWWRRRRRDRQRKPQRLLGGPSCPRGSRSPAWRGCRRYARPWG